MRKLLLLAICLATVACGAAGERLQEAQANPVQENPVQGSLRDVVPRGGDYVYNFMLSNPSAEPQTLVYELELVLDGGATSYEHVSLAPVTVPPGASLVVNLDSPTRPGAGGYSHWIIRLFDLDDKLVVRQAGPISPAEED